MRDTISHLKLKLVKAEEDTSCAALNRLRAKLRELMKDGQKVDQQVPVVVERSMQTSVDLSKSYEDLLRTENERLQAELTQIQRSLKKVVTPIPEESVLPLPTDEEEIDRSVLLNQLRNCETLLAELKTHLEEKTAYAEALRSELDQQKASVVAPALDLDQVTVSPTTMMDEMKEELEKRDDKVFPSVFVNTRSRLRDMLKVMNVLCRHVYSCFVEMKQMLEDVYTCPTP